MHIEGSELTPVPGLLPAVVGQQRLMVVLQETLHLGQDVEPPVVQNLGQVGHAPHADPLRWDRKYKKLKTYTKKNDLKMVINLVKYFYSFLTGYILYFSGI